MKTKKSAFLAVMSARLKYCRRVSCSESNIAAFAAKMATRADIDNLRRILEQEQRAIALNDTSQDNSKMFHLVLAGAQTRCYWQR
jgi:DNA-binding FadR family transcriptional regulator